MNDKTIWDKIQTNPAMLELLAKEPKHDEFIYNANFIENLCKWTLKYYELVCELDSVYNQ